MTTLNWKTIFNPFERFSERTLLIFGSTATIVGSLLSGFFKISFDGIIQAHINPFQTYQNAFFENVINTLMCFFVFFVLAKSINKKTRAIDILVVSLLYRIPFYLLSTFMNNSYINKITMEVIQNKSPMRLNPMELAILSLYGVLVLLFLIYAILLLVNNLSSV